MNEPSADQKDAPKSTKPPILAGVLAMAMVGAVVWWMINDALGPTKKAQVGAPTPAVPAAPSETIVTVKGGALANESIEALVKQEEIAKNNATHRNLATAFAPIPAGTKGKLIGTNGDFRQIRIVDTDGTDLDVWVRASAVDVETVAR